MAGRNGKAELKKPFAGVLPPLTTAERDNLRASIELEGVQDAGWMTEDGRVLDGHNRLAVDPKTPLRVVPGSKDWTDAECVGWILGHADGRRNLSPDQKRDVLERKKQTAAELRTQDPRRFTQQVIGRLLGVGRETVRDWFTTNGGSANGGTPHRPDARVKIPEREHLVIFDRVAAGESQAQVAADYGVRQQRVSGIVREVAKERDAELERAARRVTVAGDLGVVHGDFRAVGEQLADDSIDLIFTDPPYARESLSLYGELAELAARKLVPGGSLVCYYGQYALPEVLALVTPHLRFLWSLSVVHSGDCARMKLYGIVVKWKPLLWFVRGRRGDMRKFVDDMVVSQPEKDAHDWQQSLVEATYYVEKLTPAGGFVFDPFGGGGTTAVAAKQLGRKYLTCDVDEAAVSTARDRLAGETS
jgi:hypothetical protein